MNKIYLVMADTIYEGSRPVKVFRNKHRAQALADVSNDHEAKKPRGPDLIEDTPENDAAHDRWWSRLKSWERQHPAGKAYASGGYSFSVVPLRYNSTP